MIVSDTNPGRRLRQASLPWADFRGHPLGPKCGEAIQSDSNTSRLVVGVIVFDIWYFRHRYVETALASDRQFLNIEAKPNRAAVCSIHSRDPDQNENPPYISGPTGRRKSAQGKLALRAPPWVNVVSTNQALNRAAEHAFRRPQPGPLLRPIEDDLISHLPATS